ncbi:hypothetical protein [Bradyrhizobium valentinum]|uniref:Uncharacterized protein n=1 Tax=Bradyrhizobium valentinum TaxID=1518501 RepID=A0A0R3LM56_9BRAD|nr:hypothetical protein [Bradyrhizobium valentinum]KRR06837.1 hypothetical protein CP49_01655 [Bradyrhizobium valentinum]
MVKLLTAEDLRAFFRGFAAAIELDQIRVDTLPAHRFHHEYSDSVWRSWRNTHLRYLNQLLLTLDMIPPAELEKLTWIATNHEPAFLGEATLNVFAEAATSSAEMNDLATAKLFFDRFIEVVMRSSNPKLVDGDAAALMMRWLPVTDPLRIAQDPECGYRIPLGCVN